MKKNKMMRTASGLLVATLLTTSVISGTFAKYTTEDEGSDTARVAKWGVTVSTSGNLFGKAYAKNGVQDTGDSIVATTAENTVKSAVDGENFVAPGTKNEEGFTVAIAGTPEVAYNVTATSDAKKPIEDIFLGEGDWGVMVEAKGLNAASDVTGYYTTTDNTTYEKATVWTEGQKYYELMNHVVVDDDYYPINWKVTGSAAEIDKTSNLSEIATIMTTNLSKQNQTPGTAADASYTLTWEWPYGAGTNDAKDTILGNLQAGASDVAVVYASNTGVNGAPENSYSIPTEQNYNLDINFNLKVTVTQVD